MSPTKSDTELAHYALGEAVRRGVLVRPEICELCSQKPKRTIHAHHHLGYSEEHWLDVQWLCQPCHRRVHHPKMKPRPISDELREKRRQAGRAGGHGRAAKLTKEQLSTIGSMGAKKGVEARWSAHRKEKADAVARAK